MCSPAPGRIEVAAGGDLIAVVLYDQCLYCDYTSIYTCINVHSSCHFIVGVFARPMNFTSEFAKIVLSKCVIHAGFVTVA